MRDRLTIALTIILIVVVVAATIYLGTSFEYPPSIVGP